MSSFGIEQAVPVFAGDNPHYGVEVDKLIAGSRAKINARGARPIEYPSDVYRSPAIMGRKHGAADVAHTVLMNTYKGTEDYVKLAEANRKRLRITPDVVKHTPNVVFLDNPADLMPNMGYLDVAGVCTYQDDTHFDGYVVPADMAGGDFQIMMSSGDCPPLVGSFSSQGKDFIFGVHCGYKGTIGGIVENLVDLVGTEIGIDESSLNAFVGASSQAAQLPIDQLGERGLRLPGVMAKMETDSGLTVVFNNQHEVLYRVIDGFGSALGELIYVDHNSVTDPRFASYRAHHKSPKVFGIPEKDPRVAGQKGRNMVTVQPV